MYPSVFIACLFSKRIILKCCANQIIPHFPLPLSSVENQTSNFTQTQSYSIICNKPYCLVHPKCPRSKIWFVATKDSKINCHRFDFYWLENAHIICRFFIHFIDFIIASCYVFYLINDKCGQTTARQCTRFMNPLTNTANKCKTFFTSIVWNTLQWMWFIRSSEPFLCYWLCLLHCFLLFFVVANWSKCDIRMQYHEYESE